MNPDLIILGKDPDSFDERNTYSRWLLQCPNCGLVRPVSYGSMNKTTRRGHSLCQACSSLRPIENISGHTIILEQQVSRRANGGILALVQCPICGAERQMLRSNAACRGTLCSFCSRSRSRMEPILDIPGQVIIIEQIASHSANHSLALVECPNCRARRLMERGNIRTRQSTLCESCNQAGERSPRWRGGHRYYYGANWPKLAANIRERDFHTCQYPGCDETSASYGKLLDVHHIVPWHETQDNSEYNLITLCHSCHMWAEWHLGESIPALSAIVDVIYNGW